VGSGTKTRGGAGRRAVLTVEKKMSTGSEKYGSGTRGREEEGRLTEP